MALWSHMGDGDSGDSGFGDLGSQARMDLGDYIYGDGLDGGVRHRATLPNTGPSRVLVTGCGRIGVFVRHGVLCPEADSLHAYHLACIRPRWKRVSFLGDSAVRPLRSRALVLSATSVVPLSAY